MMYSRFGLVVSLVLSLFPVLVHGQDRPAPVIRTITPSVGPASGGTVVTITGENLGTPGGFACLLPCPPRVTFDNVSVDAQESRTTLVVVTPPHAAGVVDVKVITPDGRTAAATGAFTYSSASESKYERLLLPIYLDGTVSGANGSRWRTDFWLRNNSSEALTLAPWPCPPNSTCPAVFPLTQVVPAGETLHNLPPFFFVPSTNQSRVLFASTNAADRLSANLRIFDESRADVDAGAEIPLVRERDLHTSTLQLHAVPLNGAYRLNLRIYDLEQTSSRFRVRVFEDFAGNGTAQPITELELTADTIQTGEFRWQAAYAEYGALTSLLNNPIPRPALIRVQIEPLTAGSKFWAFMSVTNNATQRVTLITPQ